MHAPHDRRERGHRTWSSLLVVATAALVLTVLPAAPGQADPIEGLNVSGTPTMPTDKAKLEGLQFYVPAEDSSGTPVTVPYFDVDGNQLGTRDRTKPQVALYADEIPGAGAQDVVAAYSRDDGATWATTDLSFGAQRSSFTVHEGTEDEAAYPGKVTKPAMQSKGSLVFAAWTSAYCDSGFPAYEVPGTPDPYGVAGEQGSTDYSDLGYPGLELPYMCVWAARGVVDQALDPVTQQPVNPATFGDITWFQPERLTSGTRYAIQLAIASAQNGGFALSWAEDPLGLRPGEGSGPGAGWTGANSNFETEIWYSYIGWADFAKKATVKVTHPDDPAEIAARPQPAVRMSMPVRISDNEMVTPSSLPTQPWMDGLCDYTTTVLDEESSEPHVFCVSDEGTPEDDSDDRIFNGNTAATRPFLFLTPPVQPQPGVNTVPWAVIAYEETKGYGEHNDRLDPDSDGGMGEAPCGTTGKNLLYVSFAMNAPVTVAAGDIMNPQLTDESGQPLWAVDEDTGEQVVDWKGDPIPLRENARRSRFLVQPAWQKGPSGLVMFGMYRAGTDSNAGAADLFANRWIVPAGYVGNPYDFSLMETERINVGAVTATEMWTDGSTGRSKPVRWVQTEANLDDDSQALPMDSARGHRGFLKGDIVFVGYLWTPSWEDMLDGKDVENYYVRRSFDGGAHFTSTPAALGGTGSVSCYSGNAPLTGALWTGPCVQVAPGAFEPARNLSRIDGLDDTIIEPRLVGLPGTIAKPAWDPDGAVYPEDTQTVKNVWQVWGSGVNAPEPDPEDTEDEGKAPLDLFYAASRDYGDHYSVPAPLASGVSAQGEAQVRFTPDGSRMSAIWNQSVVAGTPAEIANTIALDAFYRVVALPTAGPDPTPDPTTTTTSTTTPPSGGGGGTVTPPAPPVTGAARIEGTDRYRTAAATSQALFPDGAETVVVATGEDYPDALAAGPVAKVLGGPILLTRQGDLPLPTVVELDRLGATHVVVVGGTSAVGDTVMDQLRQQVETVDRVAGVDRYDTAARLSARYFGPDQDRVYVASGESFADALGAGAAAARHGVPVLLTGRDSLPDATGAELGRLGPRDTVVVGGTAAIGDQLQDRIRDRARDGTGDGVPDRDRDQLRIHRVAGTDRFGTSAALAADSFTQPTGTVFVSTGRNFPDALTASAAGHPILLVERDRVSDEVLTQVHRLATQHLFVLGGTAAVSEGVWNQLIG